MKHVHKVGARYQRSVWGRSHVVLLVQHHCYGKKRRKPKIFYPLFMRRMNPNFHGIPSDADEHVWVQSVIIVVVKTTSAALGLRFVMMTLHTAFTNSFIFSIVALTRKRRVRCVLENDTPLDDVGPPLPGGLRGDGTTSLTSSSHSNGLNASIAVD